ncbi:MAG: GTP cyclohydrolase I FolE2, partial [Spirochaetales bacterium]|nr:GTP cyclohydrolase I FolE2 [Spirochaetales bacterium]
MLSDVQNEADKREVAIRKVGVRDLNYPVTVLDKTNGSQHTVANINMFVDLPHHYRGTHMSRFVEVLERHTVDLHPQSLEEILDDIHKSFECETAHLEIGFPYFIRKKAPVSGISSLLEYKCHLLAEKGNRLNLILIVEVPVTNLCPCSKEISKYGAHSQRGIIRIKVVSKRLIWVEELVQIAEDSASSPLYTLLKRVDEKHVTEAAYENPRFVEDAAREAAVRLKNDPRIKSYQVEVE